MMMMINDGSAPSLLSQSNGKTGLLLPEHVRHQYHLVSTRSHGGGRLLETNTEAGKAKPPGTVIWYHLDKQTKRE